jgi:hypothetical protein
MDKKTTLYFTNFNFTKDNYMILQEIKTYTRTASGKSWKYKPDEIERKIIKPLNYSYYVQATPFFNNAGAYCRAYFTYEQAGYLPTKIISVNPDYTVKKIAVFTFIPLTRLEINAGYRELEIIKTAKHFNILYNDSVKIIELITPAADDKHSGMFNTKTYKWVN